MSSTRGCERPGYRCSPCSRTCSASRPDPSSWACSRTSMACRRRSPSHPPSDFWPRCFSCSPPAATSRTHARSSGSSSRSTAPSAHARRSPERSLWRRGCAASSSRGGRRRPVAPKLGAPREETPMPENLITSAPSAYAYPLLVKQLLTNSLSLYGDQEITYRGELRYTYRDFRRRIGQLASALEGLGVRHGSTVAVMDWDSHRYLESYFAIPMMGATLFTVNVRLSAQQILYTLNDSRAEVVLVHAEFVPVLEEIGAELRFVRQVVVLADGEPLPSMTLP